MIPGGQLRHHAAIIGVHTDLTVKGMGQQPPLLSVKQGYTGLIAGGFNTKNQHNGHYIQGGVSGTWAAF